MDKRFILIVEDEPHIARLETAFLEHAGYAVLAVDNGDAALSLIARHHPDLIVLDRMLPGKDGLELCRELRLVTSVPVIMVTALASEQDRLDGFKAGVDDYLCKPFNPAELVARVQAVLRRSNSAPPPSLVLDAARMTLIWQDRAQSLTRTECQILSLLMAHRNTVVNRQQLLDHCFAGRMENVDVYDRSIDNHIKNLRKKIALLVPDAKLLHSVYGVGYMYKDEQNPH